MTYLRYVALCGILLFGVPKAPAQGSYDRGADSNYDYRSNYDYSDNGYSDNGYSDNDYSNNDYSDNYDSSNVGPEPVCPYGY